MYEYTIRELIDILNAATASYNAGKPEMTDKEWDDLYFQLKQREEETDIIYPDSPTQSIYYEKTSELSKLNHVYPMRSLDKTKDPAEIESFVKGSDSDWTAMFKMDGLTAQLTYINGKLIRAETRGNGITGENITHNAKIVKNIPQKIKTKEERVIVNGEIICTYSNFEKYCAENGIDSTKTHPRNIAAGAIRLLDAMECGSRNLSFVAWDLVEGLPNEDLFYYRLEQLDDWGFDTVPRVCDAETVDDAIEILDDMRDGVDAYTQDIYKDYPIDGYVFRFNSQKYYDSCGYTDHHAKGAIAFKFYDEEHETKLLDIEWSMGRSGTLTPVAIFEPIVIEKTTVNRASLHNVSVLQEILGEKPYAGQKIYVIKSNMIIPQVVRAEKE